MLGSMVDSRQLIYLPSWVKFILIVILAASLGAAIFVAVSLIGIPDKSDWILFAIAGAQLAATVLVAALILFFSQTDDSLRALDRKADHFLKSVVPVALRKITAPGTPAATLKVEIVGSKDIFGYNYVLHGADGFRFKMWIGLNVHRLFVIYFVGDAGPDTIARLKDVFRFTFGGAETVGFKTNYEEGVVGDEKIVSIWMTTETSERFLTNPMDKMFWSHDVAMMTQSFLRTSLRNPEAVKLLTRTDPAPL